MHGDWVAQAKGGVEEGWGCHHQGQQKNRPKVSVIVYLFLYFYLYLSLQDGVSYHHFLYHSHSGLSRHTLMVSPGDFGGYSCHATNKLGSAQAETPIAVEVSS